MALRCLNSEKFLQCLNSDNFSFWSINVKDFLSFYYVYKHDWIEQ